MLSNIEITTIIIIHLYIYYIYSVEKCSPLYCGYCTSIVPFFACKWVYTQRNFDILMMCRWCKEVTLKYFFWKLFQYLTARGPIWTLFILLSTKAIWLPHNFVIDVILPLTIGNFCLFNKIFFVLLGIDMLYLISICLKNKDVLIIVWIA